jgi:hypothetical protein
VARSAMRARPNSAALKKRKRFLGRPNFAHPRALSETAATGAGLPWPALRTLNFLFFYYNFQKIKQERLIYIHHSGIMYMR